jgi:hypothetical protein
MARFAIRRDDLPIGRAVLLRLLGHGYRRT